jgi:hypothetical protein
MSHEEDKTILIETRSDVRWIKSKIIDLHEDQKQTKERVDRLERQAWKGIGILTGLIVGFEIIKGKIGKFLE